MKTHSGEKPNKCNQCDFASSQAGHLRRHLKTHSAEKSNKCDKSILLNNHRRKVHTTNFQTEADENYDSYEEDDLVKEEKVKIEEEKCEILIEKPVQPYDAEKPIKAPIEEQMIKCNDCSFSSQNEDISKLHLLAHQYSEAEIIERLPPTLKNLTFASEEEFSKNLDLLLESLSAKGKKENLK